MADEQKPKASKKSKKPEEKDEVLTGAARAGGSAAGKNASPAGVAEPAPAPAPQQHRVSMKPAKLQKKNNPHLPRKMKKAQKKAAAAQAKA